MAKKEEIELIKMSIINDGKQFVVRFPKKVAEALDMDARRDMFLFKFSKKDLHLTGELVDKQKYEEAEIE